MHDLLRRRYWIFDMDGTLTFGIHDFDAIRAELDLPPDVGILESLDAMEEQAAAPLRARLMEIERELAREGQVFFVHNRVATIHSVARDVEEAVPEAKVTVAHGQMEARELENVLQRALVLAEDGVITAGDILIDKALQDVPTGPQRTMIDAFRQSAAQA